jgi:Xaa-Pro aminopeptidase
MAAPASRLLYADSEHSADALYFGRVGVPDPFIAFGRGSRKFAVVSALEFNRVRAESDFDVVIPLERCLREAAAARPGRRPGAAEVILILARRHRIARFTVPDDFPAGLFDRLRRAGLRLDLADGPLFPQREIKSAAEAAAIREGNRCSALGLAAARRVLKTCRIRGRRLVHRGRTLTSELLQLEIETACLAGGAVSANTIAAGGDQACDPHHRGRGPIRAGDLVIVDIFPRVSATGYHGDMTRTFLRGRASDAQRDLVAAVRSAQKAALGAVRAGVNGRDVHARVTSVFAARGYETRTVAGVSTGFFHGTGHGLGLDIHEPPRMNAVSDIRLRKGSVVTVEPGLYYPGLGGCRIEDVVQVTAGAPRMLSSFPYEWEL